MKFRVKKNSKLYKELIEMRKKCDHVHKQARNLMKTIPGAKALATSSHFGTIAAGGIAGIEFKDNKPPDGWRKINYRLFYPKSIKQNKEILKKIADLPTVKSEDIAKLFNYKRQTIVNEDRFINSSCPGIYWQSDPILVEFTEGIKYKPHPDLIELTYSAFEKLKNAKEE